MSNVVTNETTKVVTKVVDVRHKAPDQAIHELMQAAKDGFAVTKIATRFNHTHVYLETSSKQIAESQQNTTSKAVGESTKVEETVEKVEVKAETAKPVAKKTTAKATATTKKVEQGGNDAE